MFQGEAPGPELQGHPQPYRADRGLSCTFPWATPHSIFPGMQHTFLILQSPGTLSTLPSWFRSHVNPGVFVA